MRISLPRKIENTIWQFAIKQLFIEISVRSVKGLKLLLCWCGQFDLIGNFIHTTFILVPYVGIYVGDFFKNVCSFIGDYQYGKF